MSTHTDGLAAWKGGDLDFAGIARTLGLQLLDYSDGTATVAVDVGPELFNPMRSLHGGVFADVVDAAFGAAIATKLADNEGFTTINLQLTFLRRVVGGRLEARAKIVRKGRTTAYLEADLIDSSGELAARASTSCAILRT